MKKVIFSLLMAACALTASAAISTAVMPVPGVSDKDAAAKVLKYDFNVKGWQNTANLTGEVNLNAHVWGDYRFVVSLPGSPYKIGYDTIAITNLMQYVPSLNTDYHYNVREFPRLGITGTYTLNDKLSNLYGFGTSPITVPVRVYDAVDTMDFKYSIAMVGDSIVGTPDVYYTDYQTRHNEGEIYGKYGARDAWYLLCSKVEAKRDMNDADSYLLFKKGAYIQLGNERIVFKKDCKFLNNTGSFAQIHEILTNNDSVDYVATKGNYQYMFLPAGSVISIGHSYATLKENMLMTVFYTGIDLNGVISSFKVNTNNRANALDEILVDVNKFVGVLKNNNNTRIDLQFFGIGTGYNEQTKGGSSIQTPDDFKKMQDTAVNAVVVAPEYYEYVMEGMNNVILEEKHEGSQTTYTCSNFVLTDISADEFAHAEQCDFYTPKDFEATAGSYTRSLTSNYNSCCVPFAINASNVVDANGDPVDGAKIYTVKSCDGINVTLEEVTDVQPASEPCLIYSPSDATLKVVFDRTPITYSITDDDLHGTYIRTTKFGTANSYMLVEGGSKFGKATTKAYPFRSVLQYTPSNGNGAPARMAIRIIGKGNPTAIEEVEVNADGSIYSLDGRKLNAVPAAGLYIKNGKVQFAK